jgi:hypothetical protein
MPVKEGRAGPVPNLENTMSRKSKIPPPIPQPAAEPTLGFTIWITLRRGMSPQSEQAFERGLADYMDSRDLQWWGTHLCAAIGSDDRSLSEEDQVDLLIWLVDGLTSATVEIGRLGPNTGMPARRDSVPVVRVQSSDLMLIPIVWLYRAGRVNATQVLDMLGGFVTTSTVH